MIIEAAREARNAPEIMMEFFERPKCKPWDIVKGRRYGCCHGLGKHTQWCLKDGKTLTVPRLSELSTDDLPELS